jgi:hypothetical protein
VVLDVLGLMNSRAPFSGLEKPSPASRAICSSLGGEVLARLDGALSADASAAEPGDRFAVKSLGGLALAQRRSRARRDPKRVGATGARDLREPLEGVCRVLGVAGPDGRADELDETEVVEPQILWMRAGPLSCGQRVLVSRSSWSNAAGGSRARPAVSVSLFTVHSLRPATTLRPNPPCSRSNGTPSYP